MYVEVKSGWLIPRFRYDERIVALVKTITGRSYDKSTRTWYIPCYHVAETMEKLGAIGFSFSSEVMDYRARWLEFQANCLRAKSESCYAGRLAAVMHGYQRLGAGFLMTAK